MCSYSFGLGLFIDSCFFWKTGKQNDKENMKEKLYTYASHIEVPSFKVCIHSTVLLPSYIDCAELMNGCHHCRAEARLSFTIGCIVQYVMLNAVQSSESGNLYGT